MNTLLLHQKIDKKVAMEKRFLSLCLSLLLILPLALTGCGNNDADKVLKTLQAIGKNDWRTVFRNLHPAARYTVFEEEFKPQMEYEGEQMVKYFKDAQFEIVSVTHEDEWVWKATKFTDVSRVMLKMTSNPSNDYINGIAFAQELASTGITELLVVEDEQNKTRGALIDLGNIPRAFYITMTLDENEFASPKPKIVNDPDPKTNFSPQVGLFYEIFEKDYKHSYQSILVETYSRKVAVAITDDGMIKYVRQIDPKPTLDNFRTIDSITDQFANLKADNFATKTVDLKVVPKEVEPKYLPYVQALRDSIAQVLKLFYIDKNGYSAYLKTFPRGPLSFHPGQQVEWEPMINVNGKSIKPGMNNGKPVIFIRISSCGSCRARSLEVKNILNRFGVRDEQIVFLSKSERAKLDQFEKQIGTANLVLDLDNSHANYLLLTSTPSMIALDNSGRVIDHLQSYDFEKNEEINKIVSKLR